ncbi:hypothetical protein C3Y90_11445 [Rhizobium sp. UPM1134]|nr:hypothetical protein [Rhizobium ruizarguesonis]
MFPANDFLKAVQRVFARRMRYTSAQKKPRICGAYSYWKGDDDTQKLITSALETHWDEKSSDEGAKKPA